MNWNKNFTFFNFEIITERLRSVDKEEEKGMWIALKRSLRALNCEIKYLIVVLFIFLDDKFV